MAEAANLEFCVWFKHRVAADMLGTARCLHANICRVMPKNCSWACDLHNILQICQKGCSSCCCQFHAMTDCAVDSVCECARTTSYGQASTPNSAGAPHLVKLLWGNKTSCMRPYGTTTFLCTLSCQCFTVAIMACEGLLCPSTHAPTTLEPGALPSFSGLQ